MIKWFLNLFKRKTEIDRMNEHANEWFSKPDNQPKIYPYRIHSDAELAMQDAIAFGRGLWKVENDSLHTTANEEK